MKLCTILGARPQFIKAAAVSRALANYPLINEIIIHTGQHYDQNMSAVFFKELSIPPPDYTLGINNTSATAMIAKMLLALEEVLLKEQPDYVLVYGDTNSTLAGALTARKLNLPLVHIEAGLRNFDMSIPEEVNRILTDRVADILFCPTDTALNNLKREGFAEFNCKMVRTGDVMMDAALYYAEQADSQSAIIKTLNLDKENYILTTVHRASNTDDVGVLKIIITALNQINKSYPVVFPMHPRTQKIMLAEQLKPEFTVIEPVGYFDMLQLLKSAKAVITDSGGLQREAYMFGKCSLILLEYTPWEELIEHGFSLTTKMNSIQILTKMQQVLELKPDFNINLYGHGHASQETIEFLLKDFKDRKNVKSA